MRIVLAGQKRFGRDVLDLVCARGWEVAAVFCPEGEDKLRIGALNRRLPVFGARELTAAKMPAGCQMIVAAHCHSYISAKTRLRAELGRSDIIRRYCRGTAGEARSNGRCGLARL